MRSLLTLLSLFLSCLSALPSFLQDSLVFSDVRTLVRIVPKLVSAPQEQQQREFRLDRLLKPSSIFLTAPIKAGSCWKDLQMRRLCVTWSREPIVAALGGV
jgi:hypothetical protein